MTDQNLPARSNKAIEDYIFHKSNLVKFVKAWINSGLNCPDDILRSLEEQLEESLQVLTKSISNCPLENIDVIELIFGELLEEAELSEHQRELLELNIQQLRRSYFSKDCSSKHEKRKEPRIKHNKFGVISVDELTLCRFMTKDISGGGACLYVERPDLLPNEFNLLGIGISKQVLASKVWSKANEIGVKFSVPTPEDHLT
jgi:hypothetical protein